MIVLEGLLSPTLCPVTAIKLKLWILPDKKNTDILQVKIAR